jgi:hypothetical protein
LTILAIAIALFGVCVFFAVVGIIFVMKRQRIAQLKKKQKIHLEDVTAENTHESIREEPPSTYAKFADLEKTHSEYANAPERTYVNVPKDI